MKFLVDECLSPELVKLAHDRVKAEKRFAPKKPRLAGWPLVTLHLASLERRRSLLQLSA